MKKNYISDIRYCQKIKQSQSFKSVDGLQKKVRKKFKILPTNQYDAEKQIREIMCFWKEGWDYEHYHPVFIDPKVFYPIVAMADPEDQTHPELKKYAELIKKIITRLRIDQEIEVNYKIQERQYIKNWDNMNYTDERWKYFKVASLASKEILKCLHKATKKMVESAQKSIKQVQEEQEYFEQEHQYRVQEIHKELLFLQQIISHNYAEPQSGQMQDESKERISYELGELNSFVANVTMILEEMKDKKHGPSLISVQPKIGELTYVLHPVMWSIYAMFYKESVRIKQINRLERQFEERIQNTEKEITTVKEMDELEQMKSANIAQAWHKLVERPQEYFIPIKDNHKRENQAHSRVVFLNLDGYQSEYNLEVARNFYQNMMYVSFPKFQTNGENKASAFEERFYNKMMFETTRVSEEMPDNEELEFMYRQEKIMKCPELYHEHIEELYSENQPEKVNEENDERENWEETKGEGSDKKLQAESSYMKLIDRNQRMFVFPIKMSSLLEKNRDQFPEQQLIRPKGWGMQVQATGVDSQQAECVCESVQSYESYLIRFLMRRYVYGQVHKFRPTHLIISYSNRIGVEERHFVEMVQELTNLAKCKVMFFPNFTASFVDDIKLQTAQKQQQLQEEELVNCYAVSNARLQMMTANTYMDSLAAKGFDNCPMTLSFLSKVIRFLKIASGTYNLKQNFQYEPFAVKLKTVKIYPYAEFLFNVLGQEYTHIADKIDKEMLKAEKYFLEERFRQQKDELRKCLPKFYSDLFNVLERLVVHGIYEQMPIEDPSQQKSSGPQGHPPSPYTIDVRRIFEAWTNITTRAGINRIRLHNQRMIKDPFDEFINAEEKEKMDAKYQTNYHIYFKLRSEGQEVNAFKGMVNAKSSNAGLRVVTFMTIKNKDSAKGKQEKIKTKENKVLLPIYKDTSVLFETNQVKNFEAFVLVMNHLGLNDEFVGHYVGKVELGRKLPSFSHEECIVEPIRFFDGGDMIRPEKFKAKCEWNFKQTDDYLILYWPSEYDFIKASLFKMMKQEYEPRICHEIFIAKKSIYTNFYRAQINLDESAISVLPRRGCSTYNYKNKLFIFGGVYQREFNYLTLQNDIVTVDLDELNPKNQAMWQKDCEQKMRQLAISQSEDSVRNFDLKRCLLTLRNLKGKLYSSQFVDDVVEDASRTKRLNSLVRPKMEVEFYELADIGTEDLKRAFDSQEQDVVIMLGGYGENFMFPHSLLTYFYHILKFSKTDRSLLSIQKRNILQKPVPINLKQPVKNKNVFQHLSVYQNGSLNPGLTRESHYIFHRAVYQLGRFDKKAQFGNVVSEVYEMTHELTFVYAVELYGEMNRNYVQFAEKIGEKRVIEESEGVKVEVVNGRNNNLFITNEDGTFVYSLNYKSSVFSQQVTPLINEAIISLDVSNNIVCAIITHKQHTRNKCVLASDKIELPDPKYAFEINNHFVNLINFIEFEQNYELHTLFMMKRTELMIAHGVSFEEYQVKDKVINTKYIMNFEGLGEIKPQKSPEIPTPTVSLKDFYDCTSFLAREVQKIFSLNFLSSQPKSQDFIYALAKFSLDMNTNNKQWKIIGQMRYLSFYYMNGPNQVYLRKVHFLEVRQNTKSKLANSHCIIVPLTPVSLSQQQFTFSIDRVETEPVFSFNGKSVHKVRVYEVSEKQIWSRVSWRRIYKNHERYQDCGLKLKSQTRKMQEA